MCASIFRSNVYHLKNFFLQPGRRHSLADRETASKDYTGDICAGSSPGQDTTHMETPEERPRTPDHDEEATWRRYTRGRRGPGERERGRRGGPGRKESGGEIFFLIKFYLFLIKKKLKK